eukprot:4704294-Prymnesium_polylepis.1
MDALRRGQERLKSARFLLHKVHGVARHRVLRPSWRPRTFGIGGWSTRVPYLARDVWTDEKLAPLKDTWSSFVQRQK